MGVVTNIIDALRRIGTPSQKAALKRQDAQLEGKEVLAHRRVRIDGEFGRANAFVATTAQMEESVLILSEDEIRPIIENVLYGEKFLTAFGVTATKNWTLADLDAAFEAWLLATDKLGFTNEAVIELLGAMFGHYCVIQLNMRWIKLSDTDGTTLAIEGVEREFRGFPFQTISKRIADSEHGFFVPVFALMADNSAKGTWRLKQP
jgi:hypothetical protein